MIDVLVLLSGDSFDCYKLLNRVEPSVSGRQSEQCEQSDQCEQCANCEQCMCTLCTVHSVHTEVVYEDAFTSKKEATHLLKVSIKEARKPAKQKG